MGGGPDDRPALVPSACGWRLSWQPIAVPRISDASRTLIQMCPGPADAKSFRLALSVPGKQTGIGIKTDHPVVANLAVVPLCEPSPIARFLGGQEVVGTQQRNERGVVNAKAERGETADLGTVRRGNGQCRLVKNLAMQDMACGWQCE